MDDDIILSTKDRIGADDAFETLKDGEPFFVLQGGDPISPATILFWADQERTLARAQTDPKVARRMLDKANRAEATAWGFQEYQRSGEYEQARKVAEAENSLLDTDRAVVLARGADRIANAVAELVDLANKLQAMDAFAVERGRLRAAATMIDQVARKIEPRRQLQNRKPADVGDEGDA